MSAATITFEDDVQPDGTPAIATKLVFSGGFNATSHAHQHAKILIGLMDQHMQRAGAAVIDPTVQAIEHKDASLAVPDAEASRIILEA